MKDILEFVGACCFGTLIVFFLIGILVDRNFRKWWVLKINGCLTILGNAILAPVYYLIRARIRRKYKLTLKKGDRCYDLKGDTIAKVVEILYIDWYVDHNDRLQVGYQCRIVEAKKYYFSGGNCFRLSRELKPLYKFDLNDLKELSGYLREEFRKKGLINDKVQSG